MKGEPGGALGDTAMRLPLAFDHTPENDRKFEQAAQLVRGNENHEKFWNLWNGC